MRLVERGCHLPAAPAQGRLHLGKQLWVDLDPVEAPFATQRAQDAVHVAQRLVHVGLVDLDIGQPNGGIALDHARVRRLGHVVGGCDRRHVDHEVALDPRGARQPLSVSEGLALVDVALLRRVPRAQVVRGGANAVLGELAKRGLYAATPTDAPPTAHALHMDAELTRGVEHWGAGRKPAALAGRLEDDERGRAHGIDPHVSACVVTRATGADDSRLRPWRRAEAPCPSRFPSACA